MRKFSLGAALAAACWLGVTAAPAGATVNHGDFLGTTIDFLQVSETTQSAGDPEPLWNAPVLSGSGDQLLFLPANFLSSCAAGTSDTTQSLLETTISAQPGFTIGQVEFTEDGDVTLTTFPPFGAPATNASAALSGTVTVIEDTSGPIAPVVIPFSGSFLPSGSFSLPADFDTNLWSGGFSVDVASQVANATKVELALTNTLDSNCAPGATSAKIQKKVAEPIVISVNAPECSVDVDKQCCVPQPVLPDLDVCEGDLVSMTLEFTGDSCKASNNDQGRAFKCFGRRRVSEPADVVVLDYSGTTTATPDTGLLYGDTVTFTNSSGTLNEKTKFKVLGDHWRKQYLKIDTSCDRALACGDQFGAFELVGLESTLGGVVDCSAPPPPAECRPPGYPAGTPCDAKIVDLVLEYNGQACQNPLPNPQSGEAECSGDATGATDVSIIYTSKFGYKQQISPSSGINDGDRIRVTATWQGGLFPNQKYLITDGAGTLQEVAFHVSCSQPLALGDEFGSFKVVGFTTKSGFQAEIDDGTDGWLESCEVPLAPPGPHCTSDLQELTLVYIGDLLGEGCSVSNTQAGLAYCMGADDPGDPVAVAPASGLVADPEDQIEFGDLVGIARDGGGTLPTFVVLDTTGAGGTQQIRIKTSCHKPLSLGDRFGSWVVFGMDRKDEGPISLGGNLLYRYTVTNPSDTLTIENVEVNDDQLGLVGSTASLGPLASEQFVQSATLFGTTTNVATATADIDGAACDAGTDTVSVDVLAPPPGPFYCDPNLDGLTMIWNGAQAVDVTAWAGAPGVTTELATFTNVQPGDAIEVAGSFESTKPVWEIFAAGTTNLIGQSQFNVDCTDWSMNGVEDCGKNQGNGRFDLPGYNNDWLLEGMSDIDETLECTPELVPNPPACGLGPELVLLMPGLLWLHRRRLRRQE